MGPCGTVLWGRALAFTCFPLLCCCQGRPLARDHSGGYLQPSLPREGGDADAELRVTAWMESANP